MSGFHLCIPRNETVQPPYFQNRIIMFCLPISTLIYLWEIYTFPGSVYLFYCSKICGPILRIYSIKHSQAHECRNWDWGRPIPFLGIHRLDFLCCIGTRWLAKFFKDCSFIITFEQLIQKSEKPRNICNFPLMPKRVIRHEHNKNYRYETIQTRRPYYKLHGSYKSISTKETFVCISLGTERRAEKRFCRLWSCVT